MCLFALGPAHKREVIWGGLTANFRSQLLVWHLLLVSNLLLLGFAVSVALLLPLPGVADWQEAGSSAAKQGPASQANSDQNKTKTLAMHSRIDDPPMN